MTEEAVRARFAAQASDEQRRAVADVVIENNGTVEELVARGCGVGSGDPPADRSRRVTPFADERAARESR